MAAPVSQGWKGRVQTVATFVSNLTADGPVKLSSSQIALKVAVLVFCTIGFVYQVWGFMDLYLKYPSSVNFDITFPDSIETPAFSICNENGYRRTKFCERNPDKCRMTERGEEVCKEDPVLCQNVSFMSYYMVPELDFLEEEFSKRTIEDLKIYGHQPEDLIRSCKASWMPGENFCKPEDLVWFIGVSLFEVYFNCYMINSLENIPKSKFSTIPLKGVDEIPTIEFVFDTEAVEYFQPRRNVKVLFSIQNAYEMDKPHVIGFSLEPGMKYDFRITPKVNLRLPHPFPSNCKNYPEDKQPTSQQMCSNYCMLEAARRTCNCYTPYQITQGYRIHPNESMCKRTVDPAACVNSIDSFKCHQDCPKSCKQMSYDVTFAKTILEEKYPPLRYVDPKFGLHNLGRDPEAEQTYFMPVNMDEEFFGNIFSNVSVSKVTVRLKNPELLRYVQTAKFESVQLFSYIGGYLGIWLGFSLLEIHILINILGGVLERKLMQYFKDQGSHKIHKITSD